MPRHLSRVIVAVLLAISIVPTISFAQSAAESSLRSKLYLDSYKTLVCRDKDGRVISASRFLDQVSKGKSFSIDKNESTSVAILSVNPPAPVSGEKAQPGPANARPEVTVGKVVPHSVLAGLMKSAGEGTQAAGRPILLSFFFHDCIPCIQEVGTLNKFRESSNGISALAVTFESGKEASGFTEKYGLTWPVAPNSQAFIDQLGVKTYPTLVLLAADGTVLGTRVGDLRPTSHAASPLLELQGWTRTLLENQHD